ncbi:MAG: DUF4286 family protein [Bdellovibrionales bacterium]|nr:DUF4286 family protein [Bdellovibrionales bacterium]
MVLYEVNLEIAERKVPDFLNWLQKHIKDMLRQKGFKTAQLLESNDLNQDHFKKYTVHYWLDSKDSLDFYLENKATTMRQEGLEKFGDDLKADRRTFQVLKSQDLT